MITNIDNSFNHHHRLKSTQNFKCVFATGKKKHNQHFSIYYAKNNLTGPRIGVVVSKRCCRYAVGRNRIKRVLKEWFRLQKHQIAPVDLVIIARKSTKNMNNHDITSCIERICAPLCNQYDYALSA